MKQKPFLIFLLSIAWLTMTDQKPSGVVVSGRMQGIALSSTSPQPKLLAGRSELSRDRASLALHDRTLRGIDSTKAIDNAQKYFDRALWDSAAKWYLAALEWNPKSQIAAEGFVLSCFHAGKYAVAYEVGSEMEREVPGLKKVVLRCAAREAESLLAEQRISELEGLLAHFPEEKTELAPYRKRLRDWGDDPALQEATLPLQTFLPVAKVREIGAPYSGSAVSDSTNLSTDWLPIPRGARLMQGWNLYHMGRYAEAERVFEKLYQTHTDREAARGLIHCLTSMGAPERLDQLVEKWGGILAEESRLFEKTATPP